MQNTQSLKTLFQDDPDPKDSPIDRSDHRGKGFNGHVGDFQLDETGPHAEIRSKEPDGQQRLVSHCFKHMYVNDVCVCCIDNAVHC